jgi:hypothetical protein
MNPRRILLLVASMALGAGASPIDCAHPVPPVRPVAQAPCFLAKVRQNIEVLREVLPLGSMDCRESVLPPCGSDKDCEVFRARVRRASGQDLGIGHLLHSTTGWSAYGMDWSYSILTRRDTILWADLKWWFDGDSIRADSLCGTIPRTGRIEFHKGPDATIWIGEPELAGDTLLRRLADIRGGDQVVFHGGAATQFYRALPRLGARQLVTLTHAMNSGTRIEALRHLLHHHTNPRLITPLLQPIGPDWTPKEPPRSILQLLSQTDRRWIAMAIRTTKTVSVLDEDVQGDIDALEYLLTPDGVASGWQHRIMDGP